MCKEFEDALARAQRVDQFGNRMFEPGPAPLPPQPLGPCGAAKTLAVLKIEGPFEMVH